MFNELTLSFYAGAKIGSWGLALLILAIIMIAGRPEPPRASPPSGNDPSRVFERSQAAAEVR